MTDVELVVRVSQRLEELLKKELGAEGSGLGTLTNSVAYLLPLPLTTDLDRIARIRNKVVHENQSLSSQGISQDDFHELGRKVERELEELIDQRFGQVAERWSCPSCNTENSPQARYCTKCRLDIVQYYEAERLRSQEARKRVELEADKAAGVELCPSCGTVKNKISARYCGGCGADIQELKAQQQLRVRKQKRRENILGQFLFALGGAICGFVVVVGAYFAVSSRLSQGSFGGLGGLAWGIGLFLIAAGVPPFTALLGLGVFLEQDDIASTDAWHEAMIFHWITSIAAILLFYQTPQLGNIMVIIAGGLFPLGSALGALRAAH